LRKNQGNWVVEIGGRIPRIKGADDIRLRRPRHTQGCTAGSDEDDDYGVVLYADTICAMS